MSSDTFNSAWGAIDLARLRDSVEYLTNGDSYLMIDWGTWMTLQQYCPWPDKIGVIASVIESRLKLPPPASFKAVILAQLLPSPSLIPFIDSLTPLSENKDNTYIAAIAESLLERAKAEKAKAEENDAKKKWELWSNLYGKSCGTSWLAPPKEEEWGWYGMRWVDKDEWWSVPENEEEKKEE